MDMMGFFGFAITLCAAVIGYQGWKNGRWMKDVIQQNHAETQALIQSNHQDTQALLAKMDERTAKVDERVVKVDEHMTKMDERFMQMMAAIGHDIRDIKEAVIPAAAMRQESVR